MNEAALKQRIDGRKWAAEVVDALPAEESGEFRQGFMQRMKRCFAVREIDPRAMSDAEAREFGRQPVSFKKYFGKSYDACPLGFLERIEEMNRPLAGYLRSRRINEEREAEDPEQ